MRPLGTALGLSPATAFRLLESLERNGYVRRTAEAQYAIGPAAVRLGLAAMDSFDLTRVAPPVLEALAAETGESVFLAVLDEGEVVYLMKQEGRHAIRTTAVLGSRRPAHATALGKTLLAFLPAAEARAVVERRGLPPLTPKTIIVLPALWEELARVRLAGYAVDREEVEEGLTCVAAPIRDRAGQVVAAVSVAGPSARVVPSQEMLGRRVIAAGLEISQGLGYLPRSPEPPDAGRIADGQRATTGRAG